MTNADISKIVDTTDEWIVERTGIRARHIAAEDETTRTLAVQAARNALAHAGLTPADIDLVIVATSTPDSTFPATATQVQADLGIARGAAFDVQAVCSGFVYGLTIADNFIRGGQSQCALVIGSETFSRILDWNDRATCVLFGDGAGAVVVRAGKGGGTNADRGILGCHIHSDGRYCDKLYVDGGPSTTKTVGHLRMEGREYQLNGYLQAILAQGRFGIEQGVCRWRLESRTPTVGISAEITAPAAHFVGLRYDNPPGGFKTCLNTKLARCEVAVERPDLPPLKLTAANRAAFEILTDRTDHGIAVVA